MRSGPVVMEPNASRNGMRLAAGPGYGNTMEVRQIRVDNRAIGHAIEIHAGRGIVLARAMQPDPVHNDVVDGAEGCNKGADESCSRRTGNLQANQTVMVRAGRKLKRTDPEALRIIHFRQ